MPEGRPRPAPLRERWGLWIFAVVSYVALGYVLHSIVLNWIVGPLYPLVVVYLVPEWLADRRGRRRPQGEPA